MWADIFSKVLPVITLIIGAFLVPTVQSRFDKRKRKEALKQELVKDVVKLYNYLAFLTNYQNQFAIHNAINDKLEYLSRPENMDGTPLLADGLTSNHD